MSTFEIGNIYLKKEKLKKIFYIAISHRTLVTWKNGQFAQFTTKKDGYISENNLSVNELCEFWNISLKKFDAYMYKYFQPDEAAKQRAHKEKQDRELEENRQRELELVTIE